jgi:hypothetical protein
MVGFIKWVYGILIALYPRGFRADFQAEMQEVFAEAVEAAVKRGWLSLVAVCLREMRDWPVTLLREHWFSTKHRGEEASMKGSLERLGEAERTRDACQDVSGSWTATLAGVLPFLILGLGVAMMESPHTWALYSTATVVGRAVFMGGYLVVMVGLGIGWGKGFPRWVYPYIGYGLIFAQYMTHVSTPGLRIFGYHLFGRESWGWRAWVLFWTMVVVVLLATRFSLRSLLQSVTNAWRDWTCLSFGLYAVMILAVPMAFDEVDNTFQFPFMVVTALILAGGALAYMRSARPRQRVLALLTSTTVSLVITMIGLAIYWDGRVEPWMWGEPDRWYEIVRSSAIVGAILLAVIFAPALLGLLRRIMSSPEVA